jgi:diguanylate cyclase (GGDEF)-like protein
LSAHQAAIRVLLVGESSEGRWVRDLLEAEGPTRFRVTRASGLEAVAQEASRDKVDVILLINLLMNHSERPQVREAVREARSAAPSVPLVVVSDSDDEALAVELLQDGAQDFLTKNHVDGPTLSRSLLFSLERHRLQETTQSLLLMDELTGLYNLRGFRLLAEQHLRLIRRKGAGLLVYLDLDALKEINDNFGHAEGNRALLMAANVLRQCFRQSDIVGRLGGDEFCALMTDAHQHTAQQIVKRLQQQLDLQTSKSSAQFRLSFSVGIAEVPAASGAPLEDLLQLADAMMYRQKRQKRARTLALPSATHSTSA